MTTVVAGDDVAIPVTLKKSNTPVDVSGATIQAALITDDKTAQLVATTAQSAAAADADWANGVVVVEFSSASTANLEKGNGWLEIEVTQSGKKTTWFARVSTDIATIV